MKTDWKNRGIKLTLKQVSAFGEEHLEYLILCEGNNLPSSVEGWFGVRNELQEHDCKIAERR